MTKRWLNPKGGQIKSSLVLTIAASIIAKLLGFVRLQQIAINMGVSIHADALMIVLQVVWLIETVLISAAVVPVLISMIYRLDKKSGVQESTPFFLHVAFVCLIISFVFALTVNLFSGIVISMLAPGFDKHAKELFSSYLLISVATPFFLTLSHFLSLVNRLLNNGVWYSIPQILTNLVSIAALIFGYQLGGVETAGTAMLFGLCLGAIFVCFIQILVIPLKPRGELFNAFLACSGKILLPPSARFFWQGVVALVIAALINEFYLYTDIYFASQLETGSVSSLGYANRLATITNMLVITSAFVILEPRWANLVASNPDGTWAKLISGDVLTLLSLIAAPFVILWVFPEQVNNLVYQSTRFSMKDQVRINALTSVFAFGVISMALCFISTRMLIIIGQHRWIFIVSLVVLPAKVLMSLKLIPVYGVQGLAIATVLSFALQALGNLFVVRKSPFILTLFTSSIFKVLACFAAVLAVAILAQDLASSAGLISFVFVCLLLVVVNLTMGVVSGFGYASLFLHKIEYR